MIVARLIQFGKLAGFHFNDSKYGDDDLDSGSINRTSSSSCSTSWSMRPSARRTGFDPAYMLDQSHNVTDPIESLMRQRGRGHARLCPGAPRRPRCARRASGRQ